MSRSQKILGEMDVKKALIKLSVPATLGMIVNALYNLIDTLFVGWGAGEIAIGGLTLAFPVQMIVIAVALMIGIGGASVFSRAYGSKDYEKMETTLNTSLRFGIIIALLIAVLGSIFVSDLLTFFGATSENLSYGVDYLRIILFGITFQTVQMILNNFTRAEGRASIAMKAMIIGTGLNILLDPFFIFESINIDIFTISFTIKALGMGVSGAALATILSQIIAFVYIVRRAFDQESVLTIKIKDFFKIDFENLKEVITIGSPTFFRNSIGAILGIIVLKTISDNGGMYVEEYTTIFGIVNRVLFFVLMPGFGLVQGLAPIAGYNFGSKQFDRLVDVVIYATKILTVYMILGFLFIEVASPLIFDIFSKSNDPFIINEGTHVFRLVGLGLWSISFQIIIGSVYQAFGYARRAMFVSLLRQFILFIPIWAILTPLFGLEGLWYTFFIADIISAIIGFFMLVHELRDLKGKVELQIA